MKKFYVEFEVDYALGPVEESLVVDAPDKKEAEQQCKSVLDGFKTPRITAVYEMVRT